MNERILKIAGQNCVGEYHAGILCWRFSENQLRKFTELIIEECATWIVNNAESMEHLGPEYFAKAMTKSFRKFAVSEWPREL